MRDEQSQASPPVLVLGATGQQGGAVARAVTGAGRGVRAAVRDRRSAGAQVLRALGADVVALDLDDEASTRRAFAGVGAVFSVQPSSGQSGLGVTDDQEIRAGLAVIDAAERAGVEHLVYSSALAATAGKSGIAHFDTKVVIEERVRASRIPWTIVRPATFMEMVVDTALPPDDGVIRFLMEPRDTLHTIAVDDIGHVVAHAMDGPGRWSGGEIDLIGDTLDGETLARLLSTRWQRPIRYEQLPAARPDGDPLLSRLAALINDGPLGGGIRTRSRVDLPALLSFEQWLATRHPE